MKILIVLTSHDHLGDTGKKTGFWLEELAVPYYVFKDAGAEITLVIGHGRQAKNWQQHQAANSRRLPMKRALLAAVTIDMTAGAAAIYVVTM